VFCPSSAYAGRFVQAFAYQDAGEVRTAMVDGQPFFALGDVCHCAGIVNSYNVAARLRDDEQFEGGLQMAEAPASGMVTLDIATPGGLQPVTFISEPHFYSVIWRFSELLIPRRDIVPDVDHDVASNVVRLVGQVADDFS
jgi:prophage antirepressor-like protein